MCYPRGSFRSSPKWEQHQGNCGCRRFVRRFMSSGEEKEILEDYKDELKKELTALEEHIQQLNSK